MITIIKNDEKEVIFLKSGGMEEPWFDHDCSDSNLLKKCKREEESIDRIQYEDGVHVSDHLHLYFK